LTELFNAEEAEKLKEPFANTISLDIILNAASIGIIILVTLIGVKVSKKLFDRRIAKVKTLKTQLVFVKHITTGLLYFFGCVGVALKIPGLDGMVKTMLAGSGALAVIAGLASQQVFANIASGMSISIFKPFRVGDRITFMDTKTAGVVEDITLMHTIIKTSENQRIVVPNSVINGKVIENASIVDEKVCKTIDFFISFNSDMDKAIRIIKEEILSHKDFFDNRSEEDKEKNVDPAPVKVVGFSNNSINLRGWIWAKDAGTAFAMICDLNKNIKERFDGEGIEIRH